MNLKLILRMLGRTLQLESLVLLLPLAVCLCYREDFLPFLFTVLITAVLGTLLNRLKSKDDFMVRDGFAAVALIWIVLCLFGALPFWFSGYFTGYVDSLFEIVSGFTTTGASILTDIEALPKGILFWRAFTSWLGGMGVLVFTLAFLPQVAGRTQFLMQAESPGPVYTKLAPKTSQSSKLLYTIYLLFTFSEIILLKIAGLSLYDSTVTTMATVCTGGLCVYNASIAAFHSNAVEIIIIVFMLLNSINFSVFFLMVTGHLRRAIKSDELRFFLGIVTFCIVAIFFNIRPMYETGGEAALDSVFQVLSIISTTGFSTTDYNQWPSFAKTLLVMIMFVGGCAGSTAGGMKCARILLLIRCVRRSVVQLIHPRSVKVVRLDGKPVEESTLNAVYAFFACFFLLLCVGSIVVAMDGYTLSTSLSASMCALTNVGPGLDSVGPAGNFSHLSNVSKLTLSFFMLVGRLEIFPVLILLSPYAWKDRR